MFGNVFERRESKSYAALTKQLCKVKGELVITLQMAQQLKTKILMLYQENYFVVSVKLNFCQRKACCIDKVSFNLLQILTIQILTLVPNKWSQMYSSEYFNAFEYLVLTSHEIKKVGEILAKPAH